MASGVSSSGAGSNNLPDNNSGGGFQQLANLLTGINLAVEGVKFFRESTEDRDARVLTDLTRGKCPQDEKTRRAVTGALSRAQRNAFSDSATRIFERCPK